MVLYYYELIRRYPPGIWSSSSSHRMSSPQSLHPSCQCVWEHPWEHSPPPRPCWSSRKYRRSLLSWKHPSILFYKPNTMYLTLTLSNGHISWRRPLWEGSEHIDQWDDSINSINQSEVSITWTYCLGWFDSREKATSLSNSKSVARPSLHEIILRKNLK